MKIRRTVTEKVVAANRASSGKSTGPGDTAAIKDNARKHGLLARHLKFQNEEEAAEFARLRKGFEEEYGPSSATDWVLVEEAAVSLWKLGILEGWTMEELANQRNAAQAIMGAVADNRDEQQLPFFTGQNGSASAAQRGWHCHELVIRSGTTKFEQEDVLCEPDMKPTRGQVLIEAKLNSSIETISRYQTTFKKDFYRAIAMLRARREESE